MTEVALGLLVFVCALKLWNLNYFSIWIFLSQHVGSFNFVARSYPLISRFISFLLIHLKCIKLLVGATLMFLISIYDCWSNLHYNWYYAKCDGNIIFHSLPALFAVHYSLYLYKTAHSANENVWYTLYVSHLIDFHNVADSIMIWQIV